MKQLSSTCCSAACQTDADHYALKEPVKTQAKARTCFSDGEWIYLAMPKRGDRSAEIECYRIAP